MAEAVAVMVVTEPLAVALAVQDLEMVVVAGMLDKLVRLQLPQVAEAVAVAVDIKVVDVVVVLVLLDEFSFMENRSSK
jgi:hypothetical protein